jgi:hypothetical protein
MDSTPNKLLLRDARSLLATADAPQVNIFRLYMWGEDKYFPYMNRDLDPLYTSLWAWKPSEVNIQADPNVQHGTLIGLHSYNHKILQPYCLLHRSWSPENIAAKMYKYNKLGMPMHHPLDFAGALQDLPEWAN